MALNWEWKAKVGECVFNGRKTNLYEGNAFLIAVYEFKDGEKDLYTVDWFFVDKDHCKRCLGLQKGSYDIFEGNIESLTLYMDKCRNWKDIITMFGKTQKSIVITVKPTEEKEVA